MRVHIPVVEYPVVEPQAARPLPTQLGGITLGVLDNQKPNANALLKGVVAGLRSGHDLGRDVWAQKPPNMPTSEEQLQLLVDSGAHLIVVASADCGSCTSWCVHDAVALERRGKPAMVLATEAFLTLARAEATAYGCPALRIIPIPHPLGGAPADEVARYATIAAKAIALLVGR